MVCGLVAYRPNAGLSGQVITWAEIAMIVYGGAAMIEAGMQAARTFRVEEQERTLYGLCLLPMRIGTWAYYKGVGSMWVVAVPFGYFCVAWLSGVLAAEAGHAGTLGAAAAVTMMGGIYVFCLFLLLVHFTMLLSLHLPRGAFPVALGVFVVIGLVMEAEYRLRQGCISVLIVTMLPFYALPLCGVMQTRIGRRLRELATR